LYGPYYGPLRVIVRDGRVERAIYEGEARDGFSFGDEVREKNGLERTVEDVFSNAEKIVSGSPPGTYRVEYDSQFGYPTLIDYQNPDAGTTHADWRLKADQLQPLTLH
jgi:hypothetical protein